jgi:hypothetical protein
MKPVTEYDKDITWPDDIIVGNQQSVSYNVGCYYRWDINDTNKKCVVYLDRHDEFLYGFVYKKIQKKHIPVCPKPKGEYKDGCYLCRKYLSEKQPGYDPQPTTIMFRVKKEGKIYDSSGKQVSDSAAKNYEFLFKLDEEDFKGFLANNLITKGKQNEVD